jgi:hypothetical protein
MNLFVETSIQKSLPKIKLLYVQSYWYRPENIKIGFKNIIFTFRKKLNRAVSFLKLRFVSKTVLRNECSRCFYLYSLSRHVSAYLMAILRWIVQNIHSSLFSPKVDYCSNSCWNISGATDLSSQLQNQFISILYFLRLKCDSISYNYHNFGNYPSLCLLFNFNFIWIKDRTMDNVQNCDSYINIPSSQPYR